MSSLSSDWWANKATAPKNSWEVDRVLSRRCSQNSRKRSSWVSGSETPGFRRRTFGILTSTMRYVFTRIACVLRWRRLAYEEGIESSCGWGRDSKATHCWYNYQNFHLKTYFSTWTIASMSTSAARAWKISSEKSCRMHSCFPIAACTSSCRAIWTPRTLKHVFLGRPSTR